MEDDFDPEKELEWAKEKAQNKLRPIPTDIMLNPLRTELNQLVENKDVDWWLRTSKNLKFTEQARSNALKAYAVFGTKQHAAAAANISVSTLNKYIQEDDEFRENFEQAHDIFIMKVEDEVYQKGVLGTHEPVIQKGEIVRDEAGVPVMAHRFDSTVFQMWVKKNIPEYGKSKEQLDVNVSGGVLLVEGKSNSIDEWENEYAGIDAPDIED